VEEIIITVLSSVGFPAAVAFYVLHRIGATMDNLTKAITRLEAKIEARL